MREHYVTNETFLALMAFADLDKFGTDVIRSLGSLLLSTATPLRDHLHRIRFCRNSTADQPSYITGKNPPIRPQLNVNIRAPVDN